VAHTEHFAPTGGGTNDELNNERPESGFLFLPQGQDFTPEVKPAHRGELCPSRGKVTP
jgi:hypothetical protein